MSDLEVGVGTELFERHSCGVTLTLTGQALHRHVQRVLADVDHMAANLSDHAQGIVGVMRLVANTSAVTQFLRSDLPRFVGPMPALVTGFLHARQDDGRPLRVVT